MNGEDVMKVEVYKKRREHWKWDRKEEERALGEESESDHYYKN